MNHQGVSKCVCGVMIWIGSLCVVMNALIWCKISIEKNALSLTMLKELHPVVLKVVNLPVVILILFFAGLMIVHVYFGVMKGISIRERLLVLVFLIMMDGLLVFVTWQHLIVPLNTYILSLKTSLSSYS